MSESVDSLENNSVNPTHLELLQTFFSSAIAIEGMSPIKNGVSIAIYVDEKGPVSLSREKDKPRILLEQNSKPDLTFWITEAGLKHLNSKPWTSVGEIGIEILKLMAGPDPMKLKAKVHIGPFDLFRNGYLGVIALGGPTFLSFLASKGLTGIGKIKNAINQFR